MSIDRLSEARGEGDHVRLAYDGKDLEIMTTGNVHEHLKELLDPHHQGGGIVVGHRPRGLRRDDVAIGEMPGGDSRRTCRITSIPRRSGRPSRRWPASRRTPPTIPGPTWPSRSTSRRPQVDRPSIYAALRVAEVWRLVKGRTLIIEQLQPDGSYAPAEASRFLPIRADEVIGWLRPPRTSASRRPGTAG